MGNIVWESVLDKRYRCIVYRDREYRGVLQVVDEENGETVYEEQVGLAYDALFGPDVDDVYTWQETCIDVVDNLGG